MKKLGSRVAGCGHLPAACPVLAPVVQPFARTNDEPVTDSRNSSLYGLIEVPLGWQPGFEWPHGDCFDRIVGGGRTLSAASNGDVQDVGDVFASRRSRPVRKRIVMPSITRRQ